MTTLEPGASDVFTQGLVLSPASTALLASSPAPSITDGFDVFVQLVMAAMATSPWSRSWVWPSASVTGTDMCGRSGPSGAGGRPAVSSGSPAPFIDWPAEGGSLRSEEHTSELQSLMRISYAVFCL